MVPHKLVSAGRINKAGKPVFYGAEDEKTVASSAILRPVTARSTSKDWLCWNPAIVSG